MSGLDETRQRHLQEHFSDGLVTILGAGHSAELGIPGMPALADALRAEMPGRAGSAEEEWGRVAQALERGEGLERGLDQLRDDSPLIGDIVTVTAEVLGPPEEQVLGELLEGGRRFALAELMPKLAFAASPEMITTNYDRIAEAAIELAGLALDCSFPGAHACPFDADASRANLRSEVVKRARGLRLRSRRHVRLFKPHGSLDWYIRDGAPFRTPYRVALPRLMITPGASKYLRGYEPPFDHHREQANHAIDRAARLFTIGYGFNDPHLQTHMRPRILAGVPTLILARTLSTTARELAAASAAVTAIERRPQGGTLLHLRGETLEVHDAELWTLSGFIDQVLT